MSNAKVSIVIPVYNAEKYIERCIDSIIGQSYAEWEIIAVNDGSTDSSLARLNRYAYDKRIIVIDIPNGGVVNARNVALKSASGSYLTFVDADDYLPSDAILRMMEKMDGQDVDLVIGGYTLHWERDNRFKDVNNKKDFCTADDCLDYCIRYGETFLPVKMYRMDLFRRSVNIPHDIIFMEDTIGVMQYLCCCRKVAAVDGSIYVYFKNNGSASMTIRPKTVASMLGVAEFLMKYVEADTCGSRQVLIGKSGDLLLTVMGHLDLIPEHTDRFRKLLAHYSELSLSQSGIRDKILKLYLSSPSWSLAWLGCLIRLTRIKSTVKKLLWRMIH
ncbi:putative glycosyltransferase EpsJ [Muribaculaceae bacterium]|uniref:glycosyltransferase family 2 protein n=1 Tax=uncultured Duncaniella sp. TaxID=2768039 RepID=UPI00143470D2|nr:glycosyltransferase family A protein [uncultured Duncaniella sp.]GFI06469.1 putative glycosyltransferase EpsJ [Muribaculaceae bacterium]